MLPDEKATIDETMETVTTCFLMFRIIDHHVDTMKGKKDGKIFQFCKTKKGEEKNQTCL